MSSPVKNVVIAGARGNLGGPILEIFLQSSLNISVLTREDSNSEFPSKANIIKTNYTKEHLVSALKGQDVLISFLGYSAFGNTQETLIDAAAEAGVKRLIPSEFGHNTGSDDVVNLYALFGEKRKIVKRIQSHSSLSYTAVITGLFFEPAFQRGTFVDVKAGTAAVWDDGDVPFSTTNLRIIGQTLVKLLTDAEAYKASENQYIYLASHTTTQNEIIAAAEKATGKTFARTKISGAEKLKEGQRKAALGDPMAMRDIVPSAMFSRIGGKALTDFSEYGIFNDKFGVKDVSLEEDVKNLISKL